MSETMGFTIEFDKVVNSRLPQSTTALLLLQNPHSLSLALIHDQNHRDRYRKADQNDTERSESPSISRVLVE